MYTLTYQKIAKTCTITMFPNYATMLTATKVHKTYGKGSAAYEALRGLSLTIQQGESVAIVGKSGSGKSTLMHLLAGLDSPTSGSISFDNENLASLSESTLANLRNDAFGFIFQQFFLQPSLTVLENVALPLKIRGMSKRAREEQAMQALREVGLEDKAKNRATDLSGGQKQRAAIARALAGGPEVIFADEPTGNLDTENGAIIEKLLFSLQREKGITLVIVTHDAELANKCDTIIVMKDGVIESTTAAPSQDKPSPTPKQKATPASRQRK
jgi:putative ABC transport system ATP-binding protein